ncbi:immunity 26/phosphotriesterase HocA family protein [Aeromicrobium terrae]|uniref:immunity 26/phosphotriesterase HocA family protein n=1 Tax=Aeromicrobium terrae TaxID=2498846 RepID=UPI0016506CDF|nr:immunity 26/phosphotriesterase HocA family protein [Aeromicrobium terrae]
MATRAYQEGDWFAVPLQWNGFGLGLVARANRSGVLLGYFFGPRRDVVAELSDVQLLTSKDAILVGKFGHLGLKGGEWPIVGRIAGWDRRDWPMPEFVRYEELTGRSFKVVYDDGNPNKRLREEEIQPGVAEQRPKDGLMGAGFVEIILTKLLA